MKTVVALFDNFSDAQAAVQDLVNDGFDRSRTSLVAGDREGRNASNLDQTVDNADATATGAATGAVVGGIGGVLLGLGALAIPGIGPVIAAGPLIAGLIGAGVGATVGGLVGALVDAGLPEEHAGYYTEGVRRGGTLVSVEAADTDVNRVTSILDRRDPVDINERVSTWRESGWTGFDPDADQTAVRDPAARRYEEFTREPSASATLNQASANLHTNAGTTHDRNASATMNPASENLHTNGGAYPTVETEQGRAGRSATGNYANGGSQGREGSLSPSQVGRSSILNGDTGSRRASSSSSGVNDFKPAFRNHYQTNFANTAHGYEQFEPAYLYGYTLANDSRFENRDWREIEPDARVYWNTNHADSPWEEFKGAIRQGWQEVKQAVTS